MPRFRRVLAASLAVATFTPTAALAQASKAGVVTILEGNVTVTRVALPQPVPLKFKDDVFTQDKVTTGDKSIARMLLGGKAVVTVRERSTLTITEIPGKSTIDLDAGKIALAVARDKMKPGELIEIRTQNAVAGVRGTVVVAEVSRATAQVGGPAPTLVTTFYVLSGQVFGQQINVATGAPVGAPVPVGTLQAFRASGIAPATVTNIPPAQVAQIVAGVTTRPQPVSGGGDNAASDNAMTQTVVLANTITGGGTSEVGDALTGPVTQQPTVESTTTEETPPILPGNEQIITVPTILSGLPLAHVEINAFTGSIPTPIGGVFPNSTLATVTGTPETWAGPGPFGRINDSTLSQSSALPMLEVSSGATLELNNGAGLLELRNSDVTPGTDLVKVSGTVTQTGTPAQPLLDLIGGSVNYGAGSGSLLNVSGGTITTGGALVRASGTTFVTSASDPFINVASSVTSGGPLLDLLSGTILNVDSAAVLSYGGDVTVSSGPAFRIAGTLTAGSLAFSCGCGILTVNGPLLEIDGGAVHLGRLLDLVSASDIDANLPTNTPFVKLIAGALTTTIDTPLIVAAAADQTGIAFSAGSGTTTTLAGSLLSLQGVSGLDTNPIIQLNSATFSSTSESSVIDVGANSSGAGPLLSMTGGTLTTTQDALLGVNTGNLTINNIASPGSGGAALQFNGGTVSLGAEMAFVHPSRTLTLDRGLVSAVGTTFATGTNSFFSDPFLAVDGGGTLVATTSSPLMAFTGGSITTRPAEPCVGECIPVAAEPFAQIGNGVTTATVTLSGGGSFLALANLGASGLSIGASDLVRLKKANATISGSLYDISNSTLSLTGKTLLRVLNGSQITTSGSAPSFKLTSSTLTADTIVTTDGLGNVFTLGAPVFEATSSTITVRRPGDEPTGSTDITNFAPTSASLNVPFLKLVSSTVTVTEDGDLIGLGDESAFPTAFGVGLVASGTASSRTTINVKGPVVEVEAGTFNATQPLAQFAFTTVNQTALHSHDDAVVLFEGIESSATLTGAALSAANSTFSLGAPLIYTEGIGVTGNDTVNPFALLSSSTLTTPESVIGVGSSSGLTVQATLLKVIGGSIDARNPTVNTITGTHTVGTRPFDVAFTPFTLFVAGGGPRAFVTNHDSNTVSFLDVDTGTIGAVSGFTGTTPKGVAVNSSFGTLRAYVANQGSNTVSVIDAAAGTPTQLTTVPVGTSPIGVAVTPNNARVYVTNFGSGNVSVIDTATNSVIGLPIPVGIEPHAVAITPDGTKAYVVNRASNSISVITNATTGTPGSTTTIPLPPGAGPVELAITPDGSRAYVANQFNNTVSVINLTTNAVTATISTSPTVCPSGCFSAPHGVAITKDGTRAYVTNNTDNSVTVILLGDNSVIAKVSGLSQPLGVALDPLSDGNLFVANFASGSTSVTEIGVPSGGALLHVESGSSAELNSTTMPGIDLASTTFQGRNGILVEGSLGIKNTLLKTNPTTLTTFGSLLAVLKGASLTDTATTPSSNAVLDFTGGSVTSLFSNIVSVTGNGFPAGSASVTLMRPLFHSVNTTVSAYFNFFRLGDGAMFCASVAFCGALTNPLIQIDGGTVTAQNAAFFRMFSFAGQNPTFLKLDNGLLRASNGATITAGGVFADIRDGATVIVSGSEQLLGFVGASGSAVANFVAIGPGSTGGGGSGSGVAPSVTLSAGLFHASATTSPLTFSAGNSTNLNTFFSIFDGAVVNHNGGTFISIDGTAGAPVTLTGAGTFMFVGATSGTAVAPTFNLAGRLLFAEHATLNSGNPATNTRTHLFIGDGTTVSQTANVPLMELISTTLTTAGNVLTLRRSPSLADRSELFLGPGTLLSATGSTITTGGTAGLSGGNLCCSGVFVGQGAFLLVPNASKAIQLTNSTWNSSAGGTFFSIDDICNGCGDSYNATVLPASVSATGGLLGATNSSVSTAFSGVFVRRSTLTTGDEMFLLSDTADRTWTFGNGSNFGSMFFITACTSAAAGCNNVVSGPATATLGGSVLVTSNASGMRTTFSSTSDFIRILDGGTVSQTSSNPLVVNTHAIFNVGSASVSSGHSHFILVAGRGAASGTTPSSLSLAGPLVDSMGSTFNVRAGFVETSNGGVGAPVLITRTATDARPFLEFDGTTVNLGAAAGGTAGTGNLVDIRDNTGMSINGRLATITGSGGTTLPWNLDRLVIVQCLTVACTDASGVPGLDTGGNTASLVTFNGGFSGAHVFNEAMFELQGTSTLGRQFTETFVTGTVAGNVTVTHGTDVPIRHEGIGVEMTSGANVTAKQGLKVDAALLEASVPLLKMTAATLTTTQDTFQLAATRLNQTALGDALIRLDAATLNVVTGSLFKIGHNTALITVGDLIRLANASTLNLQGSSSYLLNISGTSFVNIGGALINFQGAGNVVTVANTATGHQLVGGIPILFTGGATSNQVSITNPIKNNGTSGTVNFTNSGALIVVDGPAARLKVQGN